MTRMIVRSDDFSIQVTANASKYFYVRINDPEAINHEARISDFLFETGDESLALEALTYLQRELPNMFTATTWVFSDLLPDPTGAGSDRNPELLRRFDKIRDLLVTFFSDGRRALESSYIRPLDAKFDGVFCCSKGPRIVNQSGQQIQ